MILTENLIDELVLDKHKKMKTWLRLLTGSLWFGWTPTRKVANIGCVCACVCAHGDVLVGTQIGLPMAHVKLNPYFMRHLKIGVWIFKFCSDSTEK